MTSPTAPTIGAASSSRGIALVAASAILFALVPIIYSILPWSQAGAGTIMIVRFAFGALSMVIWNQLTLRKSSRPLMTLAQHRLFALNGLVLLAAALVYNIALGLGTQPAKAILLVYVNPLWALILGRIFLQEDLGVRKIALIASGIIGLAIALEVWNISDLTAFSFGDWLALLDGLLACLILLVGKKVFTLVAAPPLVILQLSLAWAALWALGLGIVGLLVVPNTRSLWNLTPEPRTLATLLAMVTVCTTAPYLLLYRGLDMIQTSVASLVCLLEPVGVFAFQAIFLHQPATLWQVAGGIVLLASGTMAQSIPATSQAAGPVVETAPLP